MFKIQVQLGQIMELHISANDPGFHKSNVEEPYAKPLANDFPTELDELVGRDQETDVGGS